jgi:predicted transcriptional regulator
MSRKQRSLPAKLPSLTRLEQQVLAHLLSAIELGNYDDLASVEDLAATFGRDPKRFKQVVNRLARKGYVIVSGDVLEMVYPTVAALRHQKPDLSEAEARRILKTLGAIKNK